MDTLASDWLRTHAHGELDQDLQQAIDEVAQGTLICEKQKGEVTLKLTFEKSGRMVVISHEVKTKVPRLPSESGMYYVTESGLTKDDPFQLFDPAKGDEPKYEVGPDGAVRDAAVDDPPAAD
jgi:hypothetical protein